MANSKNDYLFEINLRITDEGIDIAEKNEHGIISYKKVSLQELVKIIELSSEKSETIRLDSGILPKNCIRHIQNYSKKDNLNGFIIFLPEQKVNFQYYKDKYDILMPNLLFYFTLKNKMIKESKVFAIKEKNISNIKNDTILYNYPFGNVYSDGNICWGSIVLPNIKEPYQLNGLPYLFVDSETNDDLFINKVNKNITQRELLTDLQNKRFNIYDVLTSKFKYSEFIKNIN